MADDNLFIEKREQGDFAIRKPNSQRASAVAPTQKDAIAGAKDINPDATIHVERLRKTSGGSPDKWRKIQLDHRVGRMDAVNLPAMSHQSGLLLASHRMDFGLFYHTSRRD